MIPLAFVVGASVTDLVTKPPVEQPPRALRADVTVVHDAQLGVACYLTFGSIACVKL